MASGPAIFFTPCYIFHPLAIFYSPPGQFVWVLQPNLRYLIFITIEALFEPTINIFGDTVYTGSSITLVAVPSSFLLLNHNATLSDSLLNQFRQNDTINNTHN